MAANENQNENGRQRKRQSGRGVVLFHFRDTQQQKRYTWQAHQQIQIQIRIQTHVGIHRYTRGNGVRVCDRDGWWACARVRVRWPKEAGRGDWRSNGKHIFQPRRLFTSHFMAFGRKLLVSVERIAARGAIETAPRKQQINRRTAKLLSSPRNYQSRPPFLKCHLTVQKVREWKWSCNFEIQNSANRRRFPFR